MARKETEIAGVRLSSPDRVLYAEQGITKEELARYYEAVAEWILPHLRDRPLSLVRCPRGEDQACFFQKHPSESFPDYIKRATVEEKGVTEAYPVVDSLQGLVYMTQIGTLELHSWGSRKDRMERPDRLVMDLDPGPEVAWEQTVKAAHELRELLDDAGLDSFVKTSGGKGLHVVVPLVRGSTWDEVRDAARAVAERMEKRDPKRYIAHAAKSEREGKVFLDYLRNAWSASLIVAYSTRAREGAPVSVPLTWEELDAGVSPQAFNVRTLPARLQALKKDPWEEYDDARTGLTKAVREKLGVD